jgi:glycosyltransferase involved in cell wall biosynthesis
VFFGNGSLPEAVEGRLRAVSGSLRLLSVTHYNYFRNLDTIIRALPLVQHRLRRPATLVLTCTLEPGPEWGPYDPTRSAQLAESLGVTKNIVQLGLVPYSALHKLYASCDAYVTAAYAESFAHPLVEAMASGMPAIASSLPVHREVCRDGALYFPYSSPEDLCDRIAQLETTPNLARELGARGRARSQQYSWSEHTDRLIALAAEAIARRPAGHRRVRPGQLTADS